MWGANLREFATGEGRRIPLPRVSEKSLEGSQAFVLMALKAAKRRFWPGHDRSREPRVGLIRTFQTLSHGKFSEVQPHVVECER